MRKTSRFIDEEADDEGEQFDTPEEDSDIDNLSVSTEVAAAEDEDFIVEVVKRRFGLAEQLDRGTGVATDNTVSSSSVPQLTSLAGLRSGCSVGYNSDCSRPVAKPSSSARSLQQSGELSSLASDPGITLVGDQKVRDQSSRVVRKKARTSVVPLSGRVKSALSKAEISIDTSEVSANATQKGLQTPVPMVTTSTSPV